MGLTTPPESNLSSLSPPSSLAVYTHDDDDDDSPLYRQIHNALDTINISSQQQHQQQQPQQHEPRSINCSRFNITSRCGINAPYSLSCTRSVSLFLPSGLVAEVTEPI